MSERDELAVMTEVAAATGHRPRRALDTATPSKTRLRHGPQHMVEDVSMLRQGVLDRGSFVSGWRSMTNPVEVRTTSILPDDAVINPDRLVWDPKLFVRPIVGKDGVIRDLAFGGKRRYVREIRRTHNLQTDMGKNQIQRIHSFGDIGTDLNWKSLTGTATTPTATTWTGAASSFPTAGAGSGNTGSQGHLLFVANTLAASAFTNPVIGVIVSNTATVATVDQWYAIPVTGAVGTTPAANSAAILMGMGSFCAWIGLSTSVSAAAAGDVLRTADGLFGDGTTGAAATEQNASGLQRAYCGYGSSTNPTFPATKQYQFQHTWTYSTTGAVTLGKVVLTNSLPAAGSLLLLDTLLSATATVSANGDTLQVTWTITC